MVNLVSYIKIDVIFRLTINYFNLLTDQSNAY